MVAWKVFSCAFVIFDVFVSIPYTRFFLPHSTSMYCLIQILLIRQSQVYMTILIIPKIHCRKLLQNVQVSLRYVFSNSTYLPVVYPLVFFSLESLQTKIGGPISLSTILNNALKYHKFGLS